MRHIVTDWRYSSAVEQSKKQTNNQSLFPLELVISRTRSNFLLVTHAVFELILALRLFHYEFNSYQLLIIVLMFTVRCTYALRFYSRFNKLRL